MEKEYGSVIQPCDLLILINDHWLSKSMNSRTLLHWWMGTQPKELDQYNAQGITLYESDSHFSQTLDIQFGISPCFIKYNHPFKNIRDQQLVRKYVQLFAVLQWA